MSYNILKVCGTGKGEDEFGPNAFRTDHINILSMGLDDFLYNGKSKSGSFSILSTGSICLIKTIPHFGKTFFWNSHSVILHRHEHLSILHSCLNVDGRIVIAELNSIVQ